MDSAESWSYWNETEPEPCGIIRNYEIGKRIYTGPFSLVFDGTAVRGPHMGKRLAFKFLKHRKDVAEATTIEQELKLLKTLRHRNIVPMLGDFRYKVFHCIVFPYAQHGTLDDYVFRGKARHRLSLEQSHSVLFQLLDSLSYVHAMGYCHCDVKPANILVHAVDDKARPQIWLCDFGLARSHCHAAKFGGIIGTDFFQAPELYARRGFSEKVDIWAVGVIVYRNLTGLLPFTSRNEFTPQRFSQLFESRIWSIKKEEVKTFVKGLLELDPVKRFSAIQAMKNPWVQSLMKLLENPEDSEKEVFIELEKAPMVSAPAN
jgi:serine/threonine protein kinase